MTEESRAAQYRRDWTERQRFQAWLDRSLAGNPVALKTVRTDWLPVTDPVRDWDPRDRETTDDDTRVDRV